MFEVSDVCQSAFFPPQALSTIPCVQLHYGRKYHLSINEMKLLVVIGNIYIVYGNSFTGGSDPVIHVREINKWK